MNPPSSLPAPEVTFGVEIEALMSFEKGKYPLAFEGATTRHDLYAAVAQMLTGAGCPARAGEQLIIRYDRRGVVGDSTIVVPEPTKDGEETGGIELRSPVFRRSNFDEATKEIQTVLSLVQERHGPLTLNRSCGLHVHVSATPWRYLAQQAYSTSLKILAIILLAFEHLLNGIVPEERLLNSMCLPLAGVRRDDLDDISLLDHLKCVLRTPTVEDLFKAMCPGRSRYMQYNFFNFLQVVGRQAPLNTVEFRLFPGTVSAAEIGFYAQLATGLVAFALRARPEDVDALLQRGVFDPAFGLLELLDALGLGHLREPLAELGGPKVHAWACEPPWDLRFWPALTNKAAAKDAGRAALEALKVVEVLNEIDKHLNPI